MTTGIKRAGNAIENQQSEKECLTNKDTRNVEVMIPFPGVFYREWASTCWLKGQTVEAWCRETLLRRIQLLLTDEIYRNETFYDRLYCKAVRMFDDRTLSGTGENSLARLAGKEERANSSLDQPLFNLAVETHEKWASARDQGMKMVVAFTVPMDTDLYSTLGSFGSILSRTAEELCAILVLSVIVELLHDGSFYTREFIEPHEDVLPGLNVPGLIADTGTGQPVLE